MLDSTLRRFLALCATYHGTCLKINWSLSADPFTTEQYLQSPLQIEHACNLLVHSELFEFHSERMLEIVVDDAQTVSNHRNWLKSSKPEGVLDIFDRSLTRILFLCSTKSCSTMVIADPTFSDLTNVGNPCYLS